MFHTGDTVVYIIHMYYISTFVADTGVIHLNTTHELQMWHS